MMHEVNKLYNKYGDIQTKTSKEPWWIEFGKISYSFVGQGRNAELVKYKDANDIENGIASYLQYNLQYKKIVFGKKEYQLFCKGSTGVGSIFRGRFLLETSLSLGASYNDQFELDLGLMRSFKEYRPVVSITGGFDICDINISFIPSSYGNRLMFGVSLR